jgi:hypothetical protein
VTRAWVDGFETIRLEHKLTAIQVVPELGGKIWSFLHKPTGKEWLWRDAQVGLRRVDYGASYDDNWGGGWEELFPNDAAGEFNGRALPDHGEWWSQAWAYEQLPGSNCTGIRLWCSGRALPLRYEKWVELLDDEAVVKIRYRITNLTDEPQVFLFKLHPALAVRPQDRVLLPGGRVMQVDPTFSTIMSQPGPASWPHVPGPSGTLWDLSRLPPVESRHQEFVYVDGLPSGWCGVEDGVTGARFTLNFPMRVFPYVWIFMALGGWRSHYTVVLEPCTNIPKDLRQAQRQGTCGQLAPRASLECEVMASLT